MDNTITRGLFLAFVRVHVLHHAAEVPIFGLEMIEELRHHGYSIGPGMLYPILHNLENAGWLRSKQEVVTRSTAAGLFIRTPTFNKNQSRPPQTTATGKPEYYNKK